MGEILYALATKPKAPRQISIPTVNCEARFSQLDSHSHNVLGKADLNYGSLPRPKGIHCESPRGYMKLSTVLNPVCAMFCFLYRCFSAYNGGYILINSWQVKNIVRWKTFLTYPTYPTSWLSNAHTAEPQSFPFDRLADWELG